MDELTRSAVKAGALTAVPLAVAVGLFGVSFGVLASAAGGIGPAAAVVMSATTFAGSAQFAAASVLAGGGGPLTAILAALLLNGRYLPIGVSVAPHLGGGIARRFLRAQLVVDESWAIAATGEGRIDPHRLVGAGMVLWLSWVAGTIVGVAGGDRLGDPAALGLDAAFPALFLALLAGQLRARNAITAAALGAGVAIILLPFTPPGVPIIAAGAAALVGLRQR